MNDFNENEEIIDIDDHDDVIKEMISAMTEEEFGVDLEDYDYAINDIYDNLADILEDYASGNSITDIDELLEDDDVISAIKDGIRDYLENNYVDFIDTDPDVNETRNGSSLFETVLGFFDIFENGESDDRKKGTGKDYDDMIDDFEDDMEGFAHEFSDDFDNPEEAMDYFEDELENRNRRKR